MKTSLILKVAAAASVLAAGAALAHPHEGGDGKEKIQKVIVLSGKDGKDGKAAMERIREFRVMRGEGGEFTCPDGEATKIDETTGKDRTKILICGDGKLSAAERAQKLEETL